MAPDKLRDAPTTELNMPVQVDGVYAASGGVCIPALDSKQSNASINDEDIHGLLQARHLFAMPCNQN